MSTLKIIITQKWLVCFTLIFFTLTLNGCARFQKHSASEMPTSSPVPSHDYLIGPGDSLNVIVWRNAEVSMAVPVRPDGKITTPLVEDMPASGKTSSQLARDIEKSLSKYIQDPIVTVIITAYGGPYSEQIRVIGQAAKPQALSYRNNMTLLDVLIAVGGLTTFANGNAASIIRSVDGKQQQFGVKLNSLMKQGDMSANVDMRPGDVLVIPESFF